MTREAIGIYCCSPGDGNNVAALKLAQALNHQGKKVDLIFPQTASLMLARHQHKSLSRDPQRSREYTHGGSIKTRGGIRALLHSADVLQTVLTQKPSLLDRNPDRRSLWVQETGLALLTYFPQLAHHLFGEIFIASPDTYGKTKGSFSAHSIARKLNATMLYSYSGGYYHALENGVKAALIEPYLPGYSLQETERLLNINQPSLLSRFVIKESGSSMPSVWKKNLIREPQAGNLLPMNSVITPTHIEEYCGRHLLASSPRPPLSELYTSFTNRSIEQITTYPSEMVMLLLTLGYFGVEKRVRLLEPRGKWEQMNAIALINTLGSLWSISTLTWDQNNACILEKEVRPDKAHPIQQVIGKYPVSTAIYH